MLSIRIHCIWLMLPEYDKSISYHSNKTPYMCVHKRVYAHAHTHTYTHTHTHEHTYAGTHLHTHSYKYVFAVAHMRA